MRPYPTHQVRRLRRDSTDAELLVWRMLRDRRLAAFKFRRQYPVEAFVADFACVAARVIIEIDGGQHAENARDEERSRRLAASGWRVIRFWNNDVLDNTQGVLETIVMALSEGPSPSHASHGPLPLPRRAGEGK